MGFRVGRWWIWKGPRRPFDLDGEGWVVGVERMGDPVVEVVADVEEIEEVAPRMG